MWDRRVNGSGVLAIMVLFGLLWPAVGLAQSQTVTTEGVAGIQGGDQGLARDNALRDALRKAVEQAVGTMVASETLVENFVTVRDHILSKSQGYVQSYKVVKEGAQRDLYLITIEATVSVGNLKNDLAALGLLQARAGKPRVLFMIAEQNIGQELAIFWWSWWGRGGTEFRGQSVEMAVSETAMKEEFLGKGFNVVDLSASTGTFEIANAYRIADLTADGARMFGKKLNAEVVVMGKALAKEGPRLPGSAVGSYLAEVLVTAIRVDNGQVLASARGSGVARHVAQHTGGNAALEKAARDAAGKLIEQIASKWTAETSGGQLIQVTIRGLAGMRDLVKIKEFLQSQVREVRTIIQRRFEGGVAVLDVDAQASAQQIGDELAKKDFPGFDLDVIGATANTLEVVAARKGPPGPQ
ncbi:flagellar assembly protein T N-terminal domain-containing protein [Nitrospira sp. Kam-Ns4a]